MLLSLGIDLRIQIYAHFLGTFKKSHENLIIAGDFNSDISGPQKMENSGYLYLLAGFGIENLKYKFTGEEISASRLTQSYIHHIASGCSKFETLATLDRKKGADQYFTALCVLSTQSVGTDSARCIDYIDNKRTDVLIQKHDWSLLSVTDYVVAYVELISQYNRLLSQGKKG